MKFENKILLSRLMTRSGDQAWDFAVPLVLMNIFPQQMRLAFFYFFALKLGTVLLMPPVGRVIDKKSRKTSLKIGIGIQVTGVLISSVIIFSLSQIHSGNIFLPYTMLVLAGLFSAIGTNIMDIAVANDLVPKVLSPHSLPAFNSRLRQLDLLTEVLSPVAAGSLMLITSYKLPQFGFFLIALWNLISFYPEYILLNQIIRSNRELNEKDFIPSNIKSGIWEKITTGWQDFKKLSVSRAILTYAILWLSVLSPHGVLLTAFLKGGWALSEPVIGTFRGLGAVFGLISTLLYPWLRKKNSLALTSRNFLLFQALMVTLSLLLFLESSQASKMLFLGTVLLSRIGLYGFSLGEMELRQKLIPENLRGEINGVASSLNSLATLIIFSLGLIFSTPDNFKYLVVVSVVAVVIASVYFSFIANRYVESHLGSGQS